jgi:hypothetical protein
MSARISRRRLLRAFAASAAAASAAGAGLMFRARQARAEQGKGPYFLIVLPAFGGGAIINSFLPIKESECVKPAETDCYPDAEVLGNPSISPLRVVDTKISSVVGQQLGEPTTLPLSKFGAQHYPQMMVTTLEHTSVNHAVAQHRSLTGGGGAYNGRTLQECCALAYGKGYPLPNVNMASLGYLEPGTDSTLPHECFAEAVAQPLIKPATLSGYRGVAGAPPHELIGLARAMRNEKLDPGSSFYQTFRNSPRLELWKKQRLDAVTDIEAVNLIDKLLFVPDDPEKIPLSKYGLMSSPDLKLINDTFPNLLSEGDPFYMQAALCFLLIKYGVSVTVTISPSFAPVLGGPTKIKNTPLAFDSSHNDHRSTQAIMWYRVLDVADRLITMLKATPFDPNTGETFWDRTMIHFATDFGRDKKRPAGQATWGTAHHLNNGTLTVSPLCNGNKVLGGVHKNESASKDGMTYGFDLKTGAENKNRTTSEAEHFAGLLQALKIDTSQTSLPDVPAMRKPG